MRVGLPLMKSILILLTTNVSMLLGVKAAASETDADAVRMKNI